MIHWELGVFKNQLMKAGKSKLFPFYKDLFKKADSILKKYIWIKPH